MEKFIKLTETNNGKTYPEKRYVNTRHIKWFQNFHYQGSRTCTEIGLEGLGKPVLTVKETAEEIMQMINDSQ